MRRAPEGALFALCRSGHDPLLSFAVGRLNGTYAAIADISRFWSGDHNRPPVSD